MKLQSRIWWRSFSNVEYTSLGEWCGFYGQGVKSNRRATTTTCNTTVIKLRWPSLLPCLVGDQQQQQQPAEQQIHINCITFHLIQHLFTVTCKCTIITIAIYLYMLKLSDDGGHVSTTLNSYSWGCAATYIILLRSDRAFVVVDVQCLL